MPSYRHLFAPGESRGDDLVAYLAALGAGDGSERLAVIAAPAHVRASSGAVSDGARLYASLCTACHGPAGRGDGPLAASFPPDLDRSDQAAALPRAGERARHARRRRVSRG